MINKINSVGNVKVYSNPNFKSEEKIVSKPTEEKQFDAKPLANYAVASIDLKNKLKITPLKPIEFVPIVGYEIKGEYIYNSNGDLYTIIDETDKTRTVYTPFDNQEDLFENIITTDKETGKIIREQYNEIEDGKIKRISIHQFSPETGKELAFTEYKDGDLKYASKTTYNKDGSESHICYNFEDKKYHIAEFSKDGNQRKYIDLTEDMKFVTIDTSIKTNNKKIKTRDEYYDGSLLNSEKRTSTTMTKITGLEAVKEKDFTLEKILTKEEIQTIGESIKGEKTYFSNGKVESIKGKIANLDVEVRFNPLGEVTDIISEKSEIKVDTHSISETNFINKNNKIITTEYNNGGSTLTFEKDNKFTEINYSDKGIISSYLEGEIEENGERDYNLSLLYDEDGTLISAYDY